MGSGNKKEVISEETTSFVRRMRLELTRSCDHYPLKVACIPISPPALGVPRTGLEPAHLAACAPETHASTNSAIWAHTHNEQKKRAENETRTRDPDLGKVVLYQLSYFRNFLNSKVKINVLCFRKRVQRYCFFLT